MKEKEIYAIYDRTAEEIVGGLLAFTHDAPVIRIFVDGLADSSTILNKHPDDFELVSLGTLAHLSIEPHREGIRTVLTGSQWKQMRDAQEGN